MKKVSIIAAHTPHRVIGKNGNIPWFDIDEIRIPDLKRFKDLTLNHTVIMGRKTYDNIINHLGKPLPKRENIVLSRNENFKPESETVVARSLEEALQKSSTDHEEVFVIGGGILYNEAIKVHATKMYITKLSVEYDGDTFFPEYSSAEWQAFNREDFSKFAFITYRKRFKI
jgi:dihydrofolate reductase